MYALVMIEPEELGRIIAERRKELGWSQDDLLYELRRAGADVSKGTISNLERGAGPLPRMDLAGILEGVLGIDFNADADPAPAEAAPKEGAIA